MGFDTIEINLVWLLKLEIVHIIHMTSAWFRPLRGLMTQRSIGPEYTVVRWPYVNRMVYHVMPLHLKTSTTKVV